MIQIDLFCGISLSPQLNKQINALSQSAFNQLMDGNSGYLRKVEFPQGIYLGRWIGTSCTYDEIENIHGNIHSIIKRFLVDYHPDENPIYLLSGQNPT